MKTDPFAVVDDKISGLLSSYKRIVVAFSGGLDSHVLLHLLVISSKAKKAKKAKAEITALHINHNVSSNSKKWAKHCQQICKKLDVKYIDKDVKVKSNHGKHSPEEILRNLRYEAFAELLPKGGCLLTAHHANDQAETLLLQLFRGAGPKGLAGIPVKTKFAKGWLIRPLLNCTRAELLQYAKQHRLKWIEDESNADLKFDRNFVRHQLLPKIGKRWPGVIKALNRSANNCAEADQLLGVLAADDLKEAIDPVTTSFPRASSGNLSSTKTINIKKLKKLPLIRQKNLIRFWLSELGLGLPSEAKLQEIMSSVIDSRYDATPVVSWKGGEIRRFRNELYAMLPLAAHDNKQVLLFTGKILHLPSGLGDLKIKITKPNIDPKKIKICFRQGGEKISLKGRKGTHDLKKLMQEWNIPPWQRDRIPLIYYDEKIIAVVDYYSVGWITLSL